VKNALRALGLIPKDQAKKISWLLVALVLSLLPVDANAERRGVRVEPYDLSLGPFKWEIRSEERPEGMVNFHIRLTLLDGWPLVRLDKHPSAGLANVNSRLAFVGEIRELPFQTEGNSFLCDFVVKKADLADPTLCFSFLLYSEEKNTGDFAWLNDFFDFPASAIAQLGSGDAKDRAIAARKLLDASRIPAVHAALVASVPKLIPYLNGDNEAVRGFIVGTLASVSVDSKKVIPALIVALDARVGDKTHDQSQEKIIMWLNIIDPKWRSRPEVTEKIKNLPHYVAPLD